MTDIFVAFSEYLNFKAASETFVCINAVPMYIIVCFCELHSPFLI
mgnify:CR=1 FL=1